MRFDQLRAFEAVARLRHFTRAAEELYLAQPSLSRQIGSLETELGADLFHRPRGQVSLTLAGETLLPVARRMLAEEEQVRRELDDLAGLRSGRVRLGATPTLCVSLIAEALVSFRERYPGIDLDITERGSRELAEGLAEGALDLAIVVSERQRIPGAAIDHTPLLREELVVVESALHSPAGLPATLFVTELAALPLVNFHQGYELRASTDEAFRAAGVAPRVVVSGAEMDAVLRFVERGIGVAVVPAMVLIDRPGLRAAQLLDPTPGRTVSLARRSGVSLSRAASAMADTILQTADRVAGPGTNLARFATLIAQAKA